MLLEELDSAYGDWRSRMTATRLAALEQAGITEEVIADLIKAFTKTECGFSIPSKARMIQGYGSLAAQVAFAVLTFAIQRVAKKWFQRRVVARGRRGATATVTFGCGMAPDDLCDWPELVADTDRLNCAMPALCECACHDLTGDGKRAPCECRYSEDPCDDVLRVYCRPCRAMADAGRIPYAQPNDCNCEGAKNVYVEVDFRNYDAHNSAGHFWASFDFYAAAVSGLSDEVQRRYLQFVIDCYVSRLSYDNDESSLRARVYGTTRSGHNDTSLGNTLRAIAMDAQVAQVFLRRGQSYHALLAGDDGLKVVTHVPVEADVNTIMTQEINEAYLRMGMSSKTKVWDDLEDASFLSGVWAYSDGGAWRFLSKPGRLLAKLFWAHPAPAPVNYIGWRHQVAEATLRAGRHIPGIRVWLERHLADQVPRKLPEVLKAKWTVMNHTYAGVDDDMYGWLGRRYGITDSEVAEFCEVVAEADLTDYVMSPYAAKIMCRDLQDPVDYDECCCDPGFCDTELVAEGAYFGLSL
jgi:hypothetical protein